MQSLESLTDQQLRQTLRHLAVRDRSQILDLVFHLAEVEQRRLFLSWGYGSMWDYCGRELLLKDGIAHIRITLARLVVRRPELRELLLNGRLGLCTACELWPYVGEPDFAGLVQVALGLSKKAFRDFLDQRSMGPTPKRDVIRRIGSAQAAKPDMPALKLGDGGCLSEPVLSGDMPKTPDAPAIQTTRPIVIQEEKVTPLDAHTPQRPAKEAAKTHRIAFSATEEDVAMLRRLQDLMGTNDIGEVVRASLNRLLDLKDAQRRHARRQKRAAIKSRNQARTQGLAETGREARDQAGLPAQTTAAFTDNGQPLAPKVRPRRPSATLADEVKARDGDRCTFVAADGTRCEQQRFLEIDHATPYALGGSSTDQANLRCLCKQHNLHLARAVFGSRVPRRAEADARVAASTSTG